MTTAALTLMITRAGQARFTAAQLDADINLGIAQIGLTDAPFVSAPTLEALPGEFKRLASISGDQVGDNIVHMTIRDDSADGYTARGFGLFLADGTLFATYAQADNLFEKSPRATFLAAIDIAFPTGDVSELVFGNTNFLNPPATTQRKGVVRLATPAERDRGTSTDTVITPADLRKVLPAGSIILWYGSTATVPAGWAICDGQEVQRSDGTGKIVTPNLTDRVAVGAGGAHPQGEAFGATQKTTAKSGAHSHTVKATGSTGSSVTGMAVTTTTKTDTAGNGSDTVLKSVTPQDAGHTHSVTVDGNAASAGEHDHTVDVTQPSLALLYIMKV
ncbi:MAG: tail fiber protein [Sphingomonas sp.]|jgi:microcystin-dependent protein|uniref:tail fiber protein n=1 Tax=Sphingomonas TaxID=13687 RepID=UPI0003630A6A|nr:MULTISPECIES: tail fiber protein [Sphingomonas]MCP4027802.1 tail fiber protein [Sphingomonas sp.]